MRIKTSIVLGIALLSLASLCAGQESRASLLGRVTDQSGGAVPGAKVQATNLATGTNTSSITNSEGSYEIPYLLPGVYRVAVEKTGFKTSVMSSVELRVSDRLALDFTLEVGQVAEAVQVTAEAPLLDTASSAIGSVVDGRRAAELPIVGGNAFYLGRLSPGVLAPGGRFAGNPFDYGSGTDIVVNGTRGGSSEVALDGAPNMFERNAGYVPPQDLVQEFKIQTATYDASLGHATGAVTNVSIKSGTNQLHGTGYLFDSRLRAVPWHTNRFIYDPNTGPIDEEKLSRNVPGWLHQRWGATATGPVVIPKLYDGRNRTFWSFGYEGLHILRNLSITATVPTEKQRQGDFSDLLRLGTQYQIYDPTTAVRLSNGRIQRQPFTGNIIPASRIDPIAKKLLEFWPLPNQPGAADGRDNYFRTQDINRNNVSYLGRVDHNFSEKHRFFIRANYNRRFETTVQIPTAAFGNKPVQPGLGIAVDDVYTFSPQLILNLRYNVAQQEPFNRRLSQGFDLLSLGLPQSLLDEIKAKSDPAGVAFPQIVVDSSNGTPAGAAFISLGDTGGDKRNIYYHTFGGTLTKIQGSHSLRFGGEFRLLRENGFAYGNVAPRLDFSNTWTRGPLDNSPTGTIGLGLASLLLGYPTGGTASINASRAEQSTYTAFFVHDDWRVTRKLSLNLGLRYEVEGPTTERFNRSIRGFDFTTPNPISQQAAANYARNPIPELPVSAFKTIGGLTFAGAGGQPRGLWEADTNNLAPRIGLAYTLTPKTVVRAGYGIFYDVVGIDRTDVNQGGFNQATNLIASLDNGLSFVARLSNPFPNGFQTPVGSVGGLKTFLGRAVSFFDEHQRNPYIQRWSLSVQQELPGRTLLEVAYVGSRGTNLPITRELNPVPRQYLSTSPTRDQKTIDFLSALVPNPFFGLPEFAGTGLSSQNISRAQLLRPFPHFTSITVSESSGYSWYHSLQVGVEKRLTKGFTFQSSWTYSKFMEAIGYLNETDLRPEEVVSDFDFTHRFVLSGIWELPFGKGRKFLSSAHGLTDLLIGGWQLQGWFEGQTGQPLGFGNAVVLPGVNLRDMVLPVSERTAEKWFKTDSFFDRNSANQLNFNIRTLSSRFGFIRGDGINNVDLSLFKNFKINERFKTQFRFETFNTLNHVQFANPNTTVTSGAFGSITGEKGHGQRQVTFGIKLLF